MSNDRFLSLFFEEANDLLQALESGLMDLEARRDDRAHLDRTFRAAHTLKGAAGMVGLPEIGAFTHDVEAILDQIRSGTLEVTPRVIGPLLEACDHLRAAVEAQEAGQSLAPPPELIERLVEIQSGFPSKSPASTTAEVEDEDESVASRFHAQVREGAGDGGEYRITFTPRPDLLQSGFNPLGILDELRELGEVHILPDLSRVPPLEELDPLNCYLAWVIELRTQFNADVLDEVFLFLGDRDQVVVEPLVAGTSPDLEPSTADSPELEPPSNEKGLPSTSGKESQTQAMATSRVRVDAGLLDELVGMAGELAVLTDSLQGLTEAEGAGPWASRLEALERIGRRLRDTTLELRMVPIEELFVRFPRVVRDLAEQTGKQITLRLEGEETRLDRTIVERLAEPMIHLIRNAIDHGLEPPELRQVEGKPSTGRLIISAGHEGDRVAIRVVDDGRGLDRAAIARRGIARGLLPPETPPDDPRVGNVIFEPGFSTRDVAGELSGRGVGLDVVRDAIRGLRGTVSLRSVEGQGTTFVIRIPLTLAMIDGLLIEANGGRFVVPMGQVEECVALAPEDSITAMGRRAAIVRGELVPTVSLGPSAFELSSRQDRQELLLTRHAEQRVGVAVDRLIGRVQAVIQPLDDGLGSLNLFSGATILADGSICLILDVATLIANARSAEIAAANAGYYEATPTDTSRSLP